MICSLFSNIDYKLYKKKKLTINLKEVMLRSTYAWQQVILIVGHSTFSVKKNSDILAIKLFEKHTTTHSSINYSFYYS
jgi:hypothetical protein